jgi:hypothetical protein
MRLEILPGAARVHAAHVAHGSQMDNLCGPSVVAECLAGLAGFAGDQEDVAAAAGSVLPDVDGHWAPPGVPARDGYRTELPHGPADESGTAVDGLVAATEHLTAGALVQVPVRAQPWTGERVEALLDLLVAHPEWEAQPTLSLRTGPFWGSRPDVATVLAHLEGGDPKPPPAEWGVGHFVGLAGFVAGSARRLAIVRDTYLEFGWQGYSLQPAERLAAALERGDGRQGGVLLLVTGVHRAQVERELSGVGFTIEVWDNGTPRAAMRV